MKAKTYQMPRSFVCDVLLLTIHLRSRYELDPETITRLRSIEDDIYAKLDAINKREAFSLYKSSPVGSVERDILRFHYLDLARIHSDWRSVDESHL